MNLINSGRVNTIFLENVCLMPAYDRLVLKLTWDWNACALEKGAIWCRWDMEAHRQHLWTVYISGHMTSNQSCKSSLLFEAGIYFPSLFMIMQLLFQAGIYFTPGFDCVTDNFFLYSRLTSAKCIYLQVRQDRIVKSDDDVWCGRYV